MCKCTQITVLALVDPVRVGGTELALVLLRVIKVLNPSVSHVAVVTVGTLGVGTLNVWAHVADVVGGRPSSVPLVGVVVVRALLAAVWEDLSAGLCFESQQIKVHDTVCGHGLNFFSWVDQTIVFIDKIGLLSRSPRF